MLQLQKDNIPDMVIFYGCLIDMCSAVEQGVAGLPMSEMNRVREFNLTKPELFWPMALKEAVKRHPKNHLWADGSIITNRAKK
jgi:hypothetical protein